MRAILGVLLLVCVAGCGRNLDQVSTATFEQAQQAFEKAKTPNDYLLSASLFQQLVDRGVKSGAVFYNQGNAYMQGGQRGRAIACYRQAQRYRPRDPQLDSNLQFAFGNGAHDNPQPLVEYVFFWQNWLSYPGKFQLSLAAATLTLVLALLGVFLNSSVGRRAAAGFLVVTFLLCCSAMYDWYRFELLKHGVIVSAEVTARKGNADSYEPAFTSPLPEGTEFTVVEQRGEWLFVRLPSGHEGWVKQADTITF